MRDNNTLEFKLMSREERISFYLGKNLQEQEWRDENTFTFQSFLKQNYNNRCVDQVYIKPIKSIFESMNFTEKTFKFQDGDIQDEVDPFCLVKNRCPDSEKGVILNSFNHHRHWGPFYKKPNDIPYEYKRNIAFWRGTTTGSKYKDEGFTLDEFKKHIRKANRFDLVTRYGKNNQYCNIGFSFLHRRYLFKDYNQYRKGSVPLTEFLKHKFIISVEGNDKDSGLNWKLNSNSLVIMPKPTFTTWLMETTLVENYHYLRVKDDWSDLIEKIIYAIDHPEIVKNMIKNANQFMSQFSNLVEEKELEKEVLSRYFEIVDEKRMKTLG